MRIKSFYANSAETAVALARREMGPDAMLVESRKAPMEARHLGEYEVVCALVPEAEAAQPAATPLQADPQLAAELAEMRRQLDMLGKTITRSAWSATHWTSAHPEMSEWHARLMAADLDAEIAQQILDAAGRRAGGAGSIEDAIAAEVEARALVVDLLAGSASNSRICALVGPPGAGKTTLIAKLAVTCGLAIRRPVELWSMDDYRVAGAEQLRSYATILGVGFRAFESVGGLAQAMEEPHGTHLILIDTPGFGGRDMDRAQDLARYLSTRPAISIHLVLTACMKSADLTHVVERFEIFHPASLLFTRLDETGSFGTAFSLSARHGIPISYLSAGQEIPEDLEPASKERLLNLLLPNAGRSVRIAA